MPPTAYTRPPLCPRACLQAYLHPFRPALFYPQDSLPAPSVAHNPCGFALPHALGVQNLGKVREPKAIVIFVGGFCDTIMHAVFREFAAFDMPHCLKLYASFKSRHLFALWLPRLCSVGLPLFVIAHSWGASNFYKALRIESQADSESMRLHYLLTLDPVGFSAHSVRPQGIRLWENVFITDKIQNPRRANIVALIGRAWNEVAISDFNASLPPPYHHASIAPMIEASHFYRELATIIQS